MQIIDCEQGTPEWFAARAGIPTASMFQTVIAKGRGGGESKTRMTYMLKLAGEILTGDPMDNYSNHHMERGHEMEAEAREAYAFTMDVEPVQVGFIRNGQTGCSPDSLIGDDGLLEVKTKLPHLMLATLMLDEFPAEHKAQCQGQLWVSEREWIDLVVYWPRLPLFVKRAYRDDVYIAGLSKAVADFNQELNEIVSRFSPAPVEEAKQ